MRGPEDFVDTHCHLLPGVDDGAADWEEALAMARQAVADGISTVVATPHQLGNFRQNDGRTIRARTAHLRDFLAQNGVQLRVLPGGELRIEPELIEGVRSGELLTLADRGRYVLLELPHEVYLPLDGLLANLRRAGLTGILAHVERNQGILAQPAAADALVRAGCLLQVTAASVTGAFGGEVQRLAERLIERRLAHVIATDAHNAKTRRPQMRRAFERAIELAGYDAARAMCCRNPAAILLDETICPVAQETTPKTCRLGTLVWLEQGELTGSPRARNSIRGQSQREFLGGQSPPALRAHVTLMVAATAFLLAPSRTCVAQGWTDVRAAGSFVCHADFPMGGLERLLGELANLQNDLATHLRVQPPGEPIELYLFRDEQSYRRYLKHYLPNMPYRRAFFFKDGGPGKVLVHRSPDFEVDIRHECTHALLHSTLPVVPLWLDEGLAEYFELPPQQRVYDNPYLASLRWSARFGMAPRLDNLEKEGDFAKLDRNDYRDSWGWVHFMLHGPSEAQSEFSQYLADIQASSPPGLLSERLARRLPDLNHQFSNHVKSWKRPETAANGGIMQVLGSMGR